MVHGLANMLAIATRGGKEFALYVSSPEFQEEVTAQVTKRMKCITRDIDEL
jgi:hypothetical protein